MAVAIPMPIRPGPTTPTVWLSIFCSSMLVPRIHAFCLGLVRLESCLKKRRQLLCGHARQTQTLERPARLPEIFIKDGTHQGQYAVGYWCRHPIEPVSYTHLRAHETDSYLVCRLLLEKKKKTKKNTIKIIHN